MNIKRIMVGALCCLAIQGAWAQAQRAALLNRLQQLQRKGIMIGHQDAPMYGTTWKWDEGKCDVKLITKDFPAIMGFDLGKLELDSDKNLDDVPFDRMRKEIQAHYERGGIITLSWHPWNPVTGKNAWDPSGEAVKAVLDGGVQSQKFDSWLNKIATFIQSLKTTKGTPIPVIFRPWHEMNGGWFWWGANSCTPADYAKLYQKTYRTLTNAGCKDLVWSWSPNLGSEHTVEAFLERYPGDSYVDMLGVDVYEFDNNDENYKNNLKTTIDVMLEAAKKVNKMSALTETGCRGIGKKQDWFMQTLWPVLKTYDGKLSYTLFWRNDWAKPAEEAYLPGVGDDAVPDFKKFYKEKKTLFLKDIKKIK